MEQGYGTDPSRRYGTGVWNGGMERVWSRSLFRTSYFDLPPYMYIYICIYIYVYINIIKYASDIHLFSCISLELSCLLVRISSVSKSFTQWIDIVRVDTKDHHSFCAEFLGSAKGRKPWFSPVRGFLPGAEKEKPWPKRMEGEDQPGFRIRP